MKKLLGIILVFGFVSSNAQQLPQYSQYLLNDYVINPAVAGSKPFFIGKANYRYQWEGITDAPRTYILSVNGPTPNNKVGLGGYIFTDHVGPTRRTGGYFSYTYHLKVTENTKLGLGLSAGLLQFMIDGSKITLKDQGDNIITGGVQSALIPDAGFGFHYYSDKWFLGASAPQLFRNRIKFFESGINPTGRLSNHFFFMGGYKFDLADDIQIEPTAMVKVVSPVPVQYELNVRGIYAEKIWLGVGYRYMDAITGMIGYTFAENISVGYSYDYTLTNIRNYSTGTHELMISLRFYDAKERAKKNAPSIE